MKRKVGMRDDHLLASICRDKTPEQNRRAHIDETEAAQPSSRSLPVRNVPSGRLRTSQFAPRLTRNPQSQICAGSQEIRTDAKANAKKGARITSHILCREILVYMRR